MVVSGRPVGAWKAADMRATARRLRASYLGSQVCRFTNASPNAMEITCRIAAATNGAAAMMGAQMENGPRPAGNATQNQVPPVFEGELP